MLIVDLRMTPRIMSASKLGSVSFRDFIIDGLQVLAGRELSSW